MGKLDSPCHLLGKIASIAFLRHLEADTKEAKVKILVEKVTEAYARAILPTISLAVKRAWYSAR